MSWSDDDVVGEATPQQAWSDADVLASRKPKQSLLNKYVLNPLNQIAGTVVEPALQMASGFVAKPVSEVMGMAAIASERFNPQGGDPIGFKNQIADSLTYQPRTVGGKLVSEKVLAPIGSVLGAGADKIGQGIKAVTGSDIAASAGEEAALQSWNFLGLKAPGKAKAAIEASNAAKLKAIAKKNIFEQPRIDAAKLAVEKYGLSLDPVVSNPSAMNTTRVTVAGQDHLLALLRRQNEPKVAAILKKDIGIPSNQSLTSTSVFDAVRESAAGAKTQIQTMRGFADDGTSATNIRALQPDALIGAKAANKKVAVLITDANRVLFNPNITGARLIAEIENLRKGARNIYKSTDIQPTQRIVADTYMGIANEFEALIERGLKTQGKTELLSQFRDGRVRMAKAYTLESATNLNTGIVDPMIIAKMTSKDNALSGVFADIGNIAGNFPESLGVKAGAPGGLKEMMPTRITRTGGGGTLGYLGGSMFGMPLVGAATGAAAGELLGNMYARRLATNPSVQRAASIPKGGLSSPRLAAPYAIPPAVGAGLFSPYAVEEEQQ